jgi:hypothetical protein
MSLIDTMIAAVPTLLAAGAVTTAINQVVQKYGATRFPRLAHACNTITVDYLAFVKALVAVRSPSKPSGFAYVQSMLAVLFAAACITLGLATTRCTPAARQALGIPALSQIDSIGMTVAHVAGWCESHGATPANLDAARQAIQDRDAYRAIELLRTELGTLAKAGESVPPELVALLNTAEGALAAQAIGNGMRALSVDTDAGAP